MCGGREEGVGTLLAPLAPWSHLGHLGPRIYGTPKAVWGDTRWLPAQTRNVLDDVGWCTVEPKHAVRVSPCDDHRILESYCVSGRVYLLHPESAHGSRVLGTNIWVAKTRRIEAKKSLARPTRSVRGLVDPWRNQQGLNMDLGVRKLYTACWVRSAMCGHFIKHRAESCAATMP